MLDFLNFIRDGELGLLSVVIRLGLALLCGGVIGLERERKRRGGSLAKGGILRHADIQIGQGVVKREIDGDVVCAALRKDVLALIAALPSSGSRDCLRHRSCSRLCRYGR